MDVLLWIWQWITGAFGEGEPEGGNETDGGPVADPNG